MSQNVDLALAVLRPVAGVDQAALVRDDAAWHVVVDELRPLVADDCEILFPGIIGGTPCSGLDGVRALLLDWQTPWATYRVEVEDTIDCGDRALVLTRGFARLADSTGDVGVAGSLLYTCGDGKITRCEGYGSHRAGRKAVGLA